MHNFSKRSTLLFSRTPMICLRWFVLILALGFTQITSSQTVSKTFKITIDSLIKAAPETYGEINSILKPKRRDTIFMRYFTNIAAKEDYLEGQAYSYNQLGIKHRNISQFNNAIKLHKKALGVANEANSIEFRILSLNMLGVTFRKSDAIKTALDYHQEALKLAESVEDPPYGIKRSINVSLNSIGNIYQLLRQHDLAIVQFKKSMRFEKELGNDLGLAINHQNIGESLEEQGKLQGALQNYKISLVYNEELNSGIGKIICKNSIAQIYIKQNKLREAEAILRPVLVASEVLGNKRIRSTVQINLGWVLMKLKNYSEAKENLIAALELAKKYNLSVSTSKAYLFLSELSQVNGDYESALSHYKKAETFNKEINNERNLKYVNDVILRYETEKKNSEIKALAKQNEIANLKLKKNKITLLISGIALVLLGSIFFILYRQYQLKNEKKMLTLEQTMLRSQMNPHFLFNSLNSIKLYIINNEQKNAVHYLNKFAKLIRKILEASSLKEISLAEELETVDLYMNIENIRFSNEINFTVTIDESLDVHSVKIPSLILQPFLENALWHGLSSVVGEKNIDLEVTKNSKGYVLISVIDNGIGRVAAEKIKKKKVLKRKSIGIDITKERLTNFSKDYQNIFDLEIIDLYDVNRLPIGTKVILHIPII